jgi:hypothetical protein
MSISTTPIAPPKSAGRGLLWLGIAITLLAVIAYAALLVGAHFLHTPWYAPALATLGVCLIILSLARRFTFLRIVALLFIGLLAAGEWWFLLAGTRLPPYAGPAAAGTPFPDFEPASLDDGTPFRRADLARDHNTVLVFFRGFW